jgi:hypothetical protein
MPSMAIPTEMPARIDQLDYRETCRQLIKYSNPKLMKKIHFFIYPVCFFLLALCGCEGTSDHTTVSGTSPNELISERTEESCEACPNDYCCCYIELWHGATSASLSLCGLEDGTYACGPFDPDPCDEFSGAGEDVVLSDSSGPTYVIVCVEENGIIRIYNTGGTTTIRITCQYDHISPQFIEKTLTNEQEVFYSLNGSCYMTPCS